MRVRVPPSAPSLLPVIGASRKATPWSRAWACRRAVRARDVVPQSMSRAPGDSPASTPRSPRVTLSRAASSDTQVTARSAPAAAWSGDGANAMPRACSGRARAAVRFQPRTAKPASSRLRTMPAPMVPSPMKATVVMVASLTRAALVPDVAARRAVDTNKGAPAGPGVPSIHLSTRLRGGCPHLAMFNLWRPRGGIVRRPPPRRRARPGSATHAAGACPRSAHGACAREGRERGSGHALGQSGLGPSCSPRAEKMGRARAGRARPARPAPSRWRSRRRVRSMGR